VTTVAAQGPHERIRPQLRLLRHTDRLGGRHPDCTPPLGGPARRRGNRWRVVGQIRQTEVEQESHPAPLYPLVLAETLRCIGSTVGGKVDQADAAAFGASVGDWPAFANSTTALLRLKQRYRPIIVSNVNRASFTASNRRLGVVFDRIITAEESVRISRKSPTSRRHWLRSAPGTSASTNSCMSPKASSTITSRPIGPGWPRCGSTGVAIETGTAPPRHPSTSQSLQTGNSHRWPPSAKRPSPQRKGTQQSRNNWL